MPLKTKGKYKILTGLPDQARKDHRRRQKNASAAKMRDEQTAEQKKEKTEKKKLQMREYRKSNTSYNTQQKEYKRQRRLTAKKQTQKYGKFERALFGSGGLVHIRKIVQNRLFR
jgi:hypothetical protein